jgi:hypothetical protein
MRLLAMPVGFEIEAGGLQHADAVQRVIERTHMILQTVIGAGVIGRGAGGNGNTSHSGGGTAIEIDDREYQSGAGSGGIAHGTYRRAAAGQHRGRAA